MAAGTVAEVPPVLAERHRLARCCQPMGEQALAVMQQVLEVQAVVVEQEKLRQAELVLNSAAAAAAIALVVKAELTGAEAVVATAIIQG